MAKKRNIKSRGLLTKPVDSSSPNPYFRTTPFRAFAVAKTRARSEFLSERLRLIEKVKPRKGDLNTISFLAIRRIKRKGKYFLQVFRPTDRELFTTPVYALKVRKAKGKLSYSVLNDSDPKTLAKGVKPIPAPQRLDKFDTRKISKQPVDYKRYLEKLDRLFAKKMITGKLKLPKDVVFPKDAEGNEITDKYVIKVKNCNLDPFYDSAIAIWKQLIESQFRKRVNWQLEGTVFYSDGNRVKSSFFAPPIMETARFYELAGTGKLVRAIGRTKSARKVYTDKFLRDIYARFIYKGIAPALASRGVISESSVRRIKAMPQNQGKKRGNWNATTMRGKKVPWWARSKVRPVCIKEVHFQFKARI